jgi:hypothetical protein
MLVHNEILKQCDSLFMKIYNNVYNMRLNLMCNI